MLRKTILLVEDNPDDEELTLLAFEDCQIANQVIVKRDGAEALDYLLGRGIYSDRHLYPMPSLVLLDLKLPKVDGLEVLRCLRSDARTKILPIIILTTSEEEQDLLNSYSLGCNSYTRKPVDFEQFMQEVRQLGVYWLLLNETPRM